MRQITTSSLANQSLATALLCHTYTVDADRLLFVRLFADQVAGNGSYTAYITVQRLGAGSAYEIQPRTVSVVASGITAIGFTTVPLPVKNTDVVKVYLLGLAGDTTTPDIVTEIWEDDAATTLATIAGYLDTEVAAIKAKTDNLPADPATAASIAALNNLSAAQVNAEADTALADVGVTAIVTGRIDAAISSRLAAGSYTAPDNATITAIAGFVDTEVAAIKAKTDLIPGAPAAVGDVPTAIQNADALLKRDMSAVVGAAARSPLNALRKLMNKVSLLAGILSIFEEDDTTVAYTQTVGSDAAQEPISSLDTN